MLILLDIISMNNILIICDCNKSINPLQLLQWFDGDLSTTGESILQILESNFKSGKLVYINLNVQFNNRFYIKLQSLLKLYNVIVYSNDGVDIDGIKIHEYNDTIDMIYNSVDNYDCYNKVVVVSDLHGNHEMLKLLLDRYNNDHIIMLGDNVDKGHNSGLVIKMLLQYNGSIEYLWGNHEWKLWQHIVSRQLGRIPQDCDDDTNRTLMEIKSCGLKHNDVLAFLSRHKNYKRFYKNGMLYNLCHGGVQRYMIPIQHNHRLKDFIRGDTDRSVDVATLWDGYGIQIHGHRDCSTTNRNICINNVINSNSILVAEITDRVVVKTVHK